MVAIKRGPNFTRVALYNEDAPIDPWLYLSIDSLTVCLRINSIINDLISNQHYHNNFDKVKTSVLKDYI